MFKVATFNVNSIRVRLPILLEWLAKEKPDVLAIQETKVADDQFPRQAIEGAGWHVLFKGQKSYNGVAFISRKPLAVTQQHLNPNDPDEEARFLTATWGDTLLINTYVPQGFSVDSPKFEKKLKFFADLKKWFSRNVSPDQPALWMGDLNVAPTEIDLWDPQRNAEHVCFHPRVRQALAETCDEKWVDLFREKEKGPNHYTFWDYLWPTNVERNRGWRIDLMMGTRPMVGRLQKIWIDKKPRLKEKPSDHTLLVAEFNTPG